MRKAFFIILMSIIVLGIGYYYHYMPSLHFIHDNIHIGLAHEFYPYDYIKSIRNIDMEELLITNNVNVNQCGEYRIIYKYKNKEFILPLFVEDVKAPIVKTKNITVLKNQIVNPYALIDSIQDDTQTHVYFYEDYLFNQIQTYKVKVVVEDQYQNKTVSLSYIRVVEKDEEPPTINGISRLTSLEGEKIDLKKGVIVEDDIDAHPSLTVKENDLNIHKTGEYTVYYEVSDQSGNHKVYERMVEVLSRYSNKEAKKDGIKTCFLTFDDGPSKNTEELLNVLKQYHIKATFFVTGENPEYFHMIKKAYEQGHVIGLHSYSHDYEYIYTSVSQYLKDLNKMREEVYLQTGIQSHYIRFPGGSSNMVSKKYNIGIMKVLAKKVINLGYQYYDWTCVNGDGENIKTVSGLIKKAKEEINDQEDIMFLMHDGTGSNNTAKALATIIEYLQSLGYTFLTIDDDSPTFHHSIHN